MFTRHVTMLAAVAFGALAPTSSAQCPPAAPSGFDADAQCVGIQLDWNAVSGATSYQVWRNTSNNYGSSSLLGTTPATQWTDLTAQVGTTYWYWVRTFRVGCLPPNNYGAPAGPEQASRLGAPYGPGLTASSAQCPGVVLEWVDNQGPMVYQVFRHTSNNYGEANLIGTTALGIKTFTDLTAVNGTTYWYWVRGVNQCGPGEPSGGASGHTGAPSVGNLTAETHPCLPEGVDLLWAGSGGTTAYQVYRNTSDDLKNATLVGTTVAATLWRDLTIQPQTTYYYWVRAQTVCGTSNYAGPATAIQGGLLDPPENIVAAPGPLCSSVEVRWEPPPGTAPGITGYEVLRSRQVLFPLAEVMGSVPSTQLSYVDPGLEPGVTYHYWVRAVNSCGNGDPNTPPVHAVAASGALITQQPGGVSAYPGEAAEFAVGVAGPSGVSYKWLRNGAVVGNGGAISGATTARLRIDPVDQGHAGAYRAVVSDGCGEIPSAAAALTVLCYPDCNRDGQANLSDFGCFTTKFALGDLYADCNGDAVLNLSDFGCFQTRFALGCP